MIDVVGVGAAGVAALGAPERRLVERADVIVSSPRLLASLDLPDGARLDRADAERLAWPSPLRAGLPGLMTRLTGHRVVVLATGDPYVSGIATTLRPHVASGAMTVHPATSSVALARARMGWDAVEHSWLSLVARPLGGLTAHCAPRARVLCLSSDETTPRAVARLLTERGLGAARMSVLGDIGAPDESRFDCTAIELTDDDAAVLPRLNVIALQLPAVAAGMVAAVGTDGPASGRNALLGRTPGRPDDAFVTDGQLTKRDVRAAALADLRPHPGAVLWDLGAGSGSVSVEWCLADDTCRSVAIERDPRRASVIRRNAESLAPGIVVQEGDVRDLPGGPRPDAVFIGGGGDDALLARAWQALADGGRLVAHAVTLETEAALVAAHRRLRSDPDAQGVQLRRLTVESAQALGDFTAWKPARAVVHLAAVKVVAHQCRDDVRGTASPDADPAEADLAEADLAEADLADAGPTGAQRTPADAAEPSSVVAPTPEEHP